MRAIPDAIFAAMTILAEAEGEPYHGQIAVGEVLRRRMRTKFFSDGTVIGTCFLRRQFSIWNDDPQDNARAIKILQADDGELMFRQCLSAWKDSATSNLAPDAVQYYNPRTSTPGWVDEFEFVISIGHHDFLRRKVA
jgi:spore germination cell wall hydrolase CwlJ-like protein